MTYRTLTILFLFSLIVIASQPAYALTADDLIGEYHLVGFEMKMLDSPYILVTDRDCSNVTGRLSMTTKALTMEMGGYYTNAQYSIYSLNLDSYQCGFYTIMGTNRLSVSIRGGTRKSVQISYQDGIFTGTWYDSIYVSDLPYTVEMKFRFAKDAVYYTKEALDSRVTQAVQEAREGLYTQEELFLAVENATSDMYTQEELSCAIANATEGLFTESEVQSQLAHVLDQTINLKGDVAPLVLDNATGVYTPKGDGMLTIGDAVILLKACTHGVVWGKE
jgi:hypothetical protein